MKLLGCIQFDLVYCLGYFSTSGRNFETGSWLFFGNRKLKISEPEVENMFGEKRMQFCTISPILLFWYFDHGRRQRLLKIFAPYGRVYRHTRTKMILATTRIEISKNEDRTLITKTHELSDEILFDFRFRWLELPVCEKLANFRFEVGNGNWKYDVAPVQGQLYKPQKFHENRSMGVRVMSPGHIKWTPSKYIWVYSECHLIR